MEQYTSAMSMHCDSEFSEMISAIIKSEKITHVIETGTYEGTGSTNTLAKCFLASDIIPERFVTMEINWNSWCKASKNLAQYSFVEPVWGRSIGKKEALAFIQSDQLLKAHENYKGIFIDDVTDPVGFYSRETIGKLGGKRRETPFRYIFDLLLQYKGENLLKKYLSRFADQKVLILLDSAGGIGFLEFQTVLKTMRNKQFILVLDDVNHVKHYRSLEVIKKEPVFKILALGNTGNWVAVKKS